ncbi:hypothetical protein [Pseudomonas sp. LTJR-52]|uniref:hypothetical protein n=1 Tax=Pseudomonas sp. LTJR-52 TaxID=2479392 RepID=UPI0013CEC9B9|nr:hypothetical protein [Pseudomonas sp. LTJR-52]
MRKASTNYCQSGSCTHPRRQHRIDGTTGAALALHLCSRQVTNSLLAVMTIANARDSSGND